MNTELIFDNAVDMLVQGYIADRGDLEKLKGIFTHYTNHVGCLIKQMEENPRDDCKAFVEHIEILSNIKGSKYKKIPITKKMHKDLKKMFGM